MTHSFPTLRSTALTEALSIEPTVRDTYRNSTKGSPLPLFDTMYPYCSRAGGIKSGPELGQNWEVWPIVAVTARRQIEQCVAHRMEGVSLLAKVGSARFRQRLVLRTGATAIGPKSKQLSDFLDRQAEIASIG